MRPRAAIAAAAVAALGALVVLAGCSSVDDEPRAQGAIPIWVRGDPANDAVFEEAGGIDGTPVDEARWAELNDRLDGAAPMFWDYMAAYGDLPRWSMADYVDAMALYTDDRAAGPFGLDTNSDLALRSGDGDLLYIPWGRYPSPDENGHPFPQAVADFSNPEWLEILVADVRENPDHLGIFLDDVNFHQWVATADGTPTWPAGWTADDWTGHLADFVEALRAEFPERTILHNTQPFLTDYGHPDVLRAAAVADLQFWEFGWTSTGVTGAEDMRSQIAAARRLHELGHGILHMATDPDRIEVERNLVGYLLTDDGGDVVGDAGARWWGADELWEWYAFDLGEPEGDVEESAPGVFVRRYQRGTAIMNWSGDPITWEGTTILDGRAHVHLLAGE